MQPEHTLPVHLLCVRAFADVARDYRAWCEGPRATDPMQLLREATRHVARLCATALELPDVEFVDHPDPPDLPKADWDAMFKSFGTLPFGYYREVFDPAIEGMEGPVVGDVADDLADIYKDLVDGLWLLEHGHAVAAVWTWKLTFDSHWGRHAVSALRALHCYGEGGGASTTGRSTFH
ncbi:DUF5063 domain-containing protein [Hydrogenophaga sp. RWCD_12]|uniref:DUF5063 domain-containing protein n=1 Tax=Hydrogenophaga sp. RWCD_12 TaxID=3391190 RepID=UPI00398552A7